MEQNIFIAMMLIMCASIGVSIASFIAVKKLYDVVSYNRYTSKRREYAIEEELESYISSENERLKEDILRELPDRFSYNGSTGKIYKGGKSK